MHPIQYLVDHLMMPVLHWAYLLTGNYGWAIVLVTVILKMVLLPLTIKQTQSMAGLRVVQPKMKELQEKYKDNPTLMQTKLMELYKEHGVNPMGGCLPTLVQLPFFLAIFASLSSKQFHAIVSSPDVTATFLWIQHLALPDKTMILPVLVGASTYFSQKTMTPAAGGQDDPMTKMFIYMPFLMVMIAMNMPAGVLIYWAFSQFITAGQQWMLTRVMKKTS